MAQSHRKGVLIRESEVVKISIRPPDGDTVKIILPAGRTIDSSAINVYYKSLHAFCLLHFGDCNILIDRLLRRVSFDR